MKERMQIVFGVILIIAVAWVAIFYAPKSSVTAQIDASSKKLMAYVDIKVVRLDKRIFAVEAEMDTFRTEMDSLRINVDQNTQSIQILCNEMEDLGKRLTEARNLAVVHGKKINDVSETVFKAAYGAEWCKEGKKAWKQYVLCGNQNLWDNVMTRLTPGQMRKIMKVDDLNQRIVALEKKKP